MAKATLMQLLMLALILGLASADAVSCVGKPPPNGYSTLEDYAAKKHRTSSVIVLAKIVSIERLTEGGTVMEEVRFHVHSSLKGKFAITGSAGVLVREARQCPFELIGRRKPQVLFMEPRPDGRFESVIRSSDEFQYFPVMELWEVLLKLDAEV